MGEVSIINLEMFVPYKCKNNCQFCFSKKFYDKETYDIDMFVNKLKKLNELQFISYYKLSGGEPLDNFEYFKKITDVLDRQTNVYTTLPNNDDINKFIDLININKKIIKVVISYRSHNDFISKLSLINKIEKYKQVNKVVDENTTHEELNVFFDDVKNADVDFINLRYDFTKNIDVTENDNILTYLDNNFLQIFGNDQCEECNLYDVNGCRKYQYVINDKLMIEYNKINDIKCNFKKLILKPNGVLDDSFVETNENINESIFENFNIPYVIMNSDNQYAKCYHGYVFFTKTKYEIFNKKELDYIENNLKFQNIQYEKMEAN